MAPPAPPLGSGAASEPTTLADFERHRELGRGGNATVYEATWRKTGQRVALKILHGDLIADPKYLVRFRREVRAASQLDHPHICKVFAYGEEEKALWLAMEIIEGGSVRDLIDTALKLPPQIASLLTSQLLSAVGAAHAAGILHRDIKPANAMVTRDGKLKLVDFGIAKAGTDATVTETGFLVGTPAYMSPEQVVGKPVTEAVDLYAIGVSLFEMIIGTNPYAEDAPSQALLKIASEPIPTIFEHDPTVPGAIESAFELLTERDVNDRAKTAAEASAALAPYVDYVEAVHSGVLKAFVEDPVGTTDMLNRERAELEVARAERLLLGGDQNLLAAGLAFYRASKLWPTPEIKSRLSFVSGRANLHFDEPDDVDLQKALEIYWHNRTQAGPVKRVADLYRARGELHRFVVYIRQYLRLRPSDSHARQQLEAVVVGAPVPELSADGKLKTQDILAGVRTGGWGAATPERKEAALSLQQPLALVRNRAKPTVSANAATMIVSRLNGPAAAVAQSPQGAAKARIAAAARDREIARDAAADDGAFAEIWQAWGKRLVVVLIVFGVFTLVARGLSKSVEASVDVTQAVISDNAHRVGAIERNDIARRQQNFHKDAVAHYNGGDYLKVLVDVNNLIASSPPADLALDGLLYRARARAKLGQREAARRDYEEYVRQTPLSDPRRTAAMTEVNAR